MHPFIKIIDEHCVWQPVSSAVTDYYWRSGDSIYWALERPGYGTDVPPIREADVNSFVICVNNFYAKDKNYVYYPIEMFDLMEEDTEGPSDISDVRIIEDADVGTFKVLGEGFAIDKNNMYFMGEKIKYDIRFFCKKEREEYMHENSFLVDYIRNWNPTIALEP